MGEDAASLLTLHRNGKQFILAITIFLPFIYFRSLELNHLQLPPAFSSTSVGKKILTQKRWAEEKKKEFQRKEHSLPLK